MKLSAYTYRLPFIQPLQNSKTTYYHRRGIILYLETSDRNFMGEAAPLPRFSTEDLSDVKTQVEKHIEKWEQLLNRAQPIQQLRTYYNKKNIASSLQFALDTLSYQVEAHKTGKNLRQFLFKQAAPQLAVNALLSLSDDEFLSSATKLRSKGFATLKCKAGINFERELQRLQQLRNRFPGIRIRLDANRAWSLEEAKSNLKKLEVLSIEYCEEPLANSTYNNYKELGRHIGIPLALDESLNIGNNWQELLPHASFLILKPMVIGNFDRINSICQQASNTDCNIIFTSSLESSIGRSITAILATGWGSVDHAQGLNTGTLLTKDIIDDQPKIISGSIHSDDLEPTIVDKTHLETIATNIIRSR